MAPLSLFSIHNILVKNFLLAYIGIAEYRLTLNIRVCETRKSFASFIGSSLTGNIFANNFYWYWYFIKNHATNVHEYS